MKILQKTNQKPVSGEDSSEIDVYSMTRIRKETTEYAVTVSCISLLLTKYSVKGDKNSTRLGPAQLELNW